MTLLMRIPGAYTDPTLPVLDEGGVWFRDTFTRPDAATLGTTEDSQQRPWQVWVQSGTPVGGVAGGEAYVYRAEGAGHAVATVDATTPDGRLTATMGTAPSSAQPGVVFRATDVGNFFRVVNAQGVEYRLQRFVSGTSTLIGAATGVKPATGDVIEVALTGASITVYINGTARITTTDTHNQAATRHGFYNNIQGSTIRDVRFATA